MQRVLPIQGGGRGRLIRRPCNIHSGELKRSVFTCSYFKELAVLPTRGNWNPFFILHLYYITSCCLTHSGELKLTVDAERVHVLAAAVLPTRGNWNVYIINKVNINCSCCLTHSGELKQLFTCKVEVFGMLLSYPLGEKQVTGNWMRDRTDANNYALRITNYALIMSYPLGGKLVTGNR